MRSPVFLLFLCGWRRFSNKGCWGARTARPPLLSHFISLYIAFTMTSGRAVRAPQSLKFTYIHHCR